MKTSVIMETQDRVLKGMIVKQRTRDSFFALNDIMNVINLARMKQGQKLARFDIFLQNDSTKDFLLALEKEISTKPYIKGAKGKTGWVHPFFALKILTHFEPNFEVQVYKWLWDYLIENRIKSGDSYVKMCGELYRVSSNKAKFHENIQNLAKLIKDTIGVDDWNKASTGQLELREYAHNMIADLAKTLNDSTKGATLGIQALKERVKTECAIISI